MHKGRTLPRAPVAAAAALPTQAHLQLGAALCRPDFQAEAVTKVRLCWCG